MKEWGYTKYFMYYITDFGALKRKRNESIVDLSKRFNNLYSKFPTEIKPLETSAKLTYANALESEFSLLLRERRSVTLLNMQEATLEVESNMLATGKLKNHSNFDQDRKCKREMASTSMLGHQIKWMI